MISEILCIFKTYQTFFTGLLGFAGVIITMLVNVRNQQKLQTRQIEYEARSLRIAIKSELLASKEVYENRVLQLKEPTEYKNALIQNNTDFEIYKTLMQKIGLLSQDELEKIIKAYSLMEELPYRLRLLAGTDNIGGYKDEFIRLKGDVINTAVGIHEGFIPMISEAIESIDYELSNEK